MFGGVKMTEKKALLGLHQPKDIDGSKELNESEFSDFDYKCPKCGFEFDAKD